MFRNHDKKWIMGFMQSLTCVTPIEVELQALRKGLKIVIQHQISPLEVDVDAQEIINMFENGNLKYDNLLCECKCLMDKLGGVEQKQVFREQNQVTDTLAKEGAERRDSSNTTIL